MQGLENDEEKEQESINLKYTIEILKATSVKNNYLQPKYMTKCLMNPSFNLAH